MKRIIKRQKIEVPHAVIERILFNEKGHITAVDIYDNKLDESVFCEAKSRH